MDTGHLGLEFRSERPGLGWDLISVQTMTQAMRGCRGHGASEDLCGHHHLGKGEAAGVRGPAKEVNKKGLET